MIRNTECLNLTEVYITKGYDDKKNTKVTLPSQLLMPWEQLPSCFILTIIGLIVLSNYLLLWSLLLLGLLKQPSVGTLLVVATIIYIFIFPFSYIYIYIYIYIYRKQVLPSYLHSDCKKCYWLPWIIEKKISSLFTLTNIKISWYL